jgi:crossover junction endodeoxyribonuclease RuvC
VRLLALDLSLLATGWAVNGDEGQLSGVYGAGDLVGWPRLASLRDDTLQLADYYAPDLVIIEAVFLGMKGGTALELAGLGQIVRLALHEAGLAFVDVAPSTLKKFATGKGNALKPDMVAAATYHLGFTGSDHNEADALWLLHAGLAHYRLPGYVEGLNRDALTVVRWPNPVILR